MPDIMDLFPDRVMPEPNSGCWLWVGPMRGSYGCSCREGKDEYAHRFSFRESNGAIRDGEEVCHSCDVKLCVNPSHLYAASHSKNMQDAYSRGILKKGGSRSDAKLSYDAVIEIRSFNGSKAPKGFYKRCAEKYGVSCSIISKVKTGKAWCNS